MTDTNNYIFKRRSRKGVWKVVTLFKGTYKQAQQLNKKLYGVTNFKVNSPITD